jgi:hypothetical protein
MTQISIVYICKRDDVTCTRKCGLPIPNSAIDSGRRLEGVVGHSNPTIGGGWTTIFGYRNDLTISIRSLKWFSHPNDQKGWFSHSEVGLCGWPNDPQWLGYDHQGVSATTVTYTRCKPYKLTWTYVRSIRTNQISKKQHGSQFITVMKLLNSSLLVSKINSIKAI